MLQDWCTRDGTHVAESCLPRFKNHCIFKTGSPRLRCRSKGNSTLEGLRRLRLHKLHRLRPHMTRMPFFQCLLLEFSCFYLGAQCEDGKEASAALSSTSELMSRIETSGPDLPGRPFLWVLTLGVKQSRCENQSKHTPNTKRNHQTRSNPQNQRTKRLCSPRSVLEVVAEIQL